MGGRDDVPLFDDETGEALNAAARQLVLDALEADLQKPGDETSSAPLGPALRSIPVVRCAEGTYKYVQVQLTHPDAPGAQLLVVRSYSSCRYHAATNLSTLFLCNLQQSAHIHVLPKHLN